MSDFDALPVTMVNETQTYIDGTVTEWDSLYGQSATDAWFKKHYGEAYRKMDFYTMACTLSGRLREMDKRARAANARADRVQAELDELKLATAPQQIR